ncbi:hypothetical protein [Chitinophaga caseinilytica]|uniref:PA14 domain-containing protein n=1 Tax=Chitinophaga caseinilytica TaxID=2267521 RepID=A0ABZ2Z454_9BACT
MKKVLVLMIALLMTGALHAQNRLVTNQYIRTKVTDKTYTQKTGTTIPNDNLSINTANSKTWLVLEERFLPAQAGRMPWESEIVPMETNIPCHGPQYMQASNVPLKEYTSCSAFLYSSFSTNLQAFQRRMFGSTNTTWRDQSATCTTLPPNQPLAAKGDTTAGMSLMAAGFYGPLNRSGIWGNNVAGLGTEWVYTRGRFYAPVAGKYYIGVAADNYFRLQIDGADFVRNDLNPFTEESFRVWHIFPITLSAGIHELYLAGKNTGNEGQMGCEVYNNDTTQLEAATEAQLNLLYTTRNIQTVGNICRYPESRTITVGNFTSVTGTVAYGSSSANLNAPVNLAADANTVLNFNFQGASNARLHIFSNEVLVEDRLLTAATTTSVTIPAGATRTFRVEIRPPGP